MRKKIYRLFADAIEAMRVAGILDLDAWPRFQVGSPKNPDHGDYAINAAMVLAKAAHRNPRELAQQIVDHINPDQDLLASIELAGPGFINVRLHDSAWQAVAADIQERGDRYGRCEPGSKGRVNIEYVSANPTGPLHVGHGRGAIVGDALARVLDAAGYEVTREYYVNDHGNQVDILARSIHLRYQQLLGRDVELPADAYPADYVKTIAAHIVETQGDVYLDAPESDWIDHFRTIGVDANLASIRRDLELIDVRFDRWSHESQLHADGQVQELIDELRAQDLIYEAETSEVEGEQIRRDKSKAAQHRGEQKGGVFARLSRFGDKDDRILLRSDGRPVYLAADLAFHRNKLQRGYDCCIDVFGADHYGHTKTLRAGMKALQQPAEKMDFVLIQIVRLIRDGKEIRISKRAGTIELLSDLVEAVGADATRFFFLMRAPGAQFDFDLNTATAQGMDNPVFYVQYGHARTCALLRRAEAEGQAYQGCTSEALARLELAQEIALLRKMSELADCVDEAASSREPHRLVYYVQDLIRDFHSYYTSNKKTERIIGEDRVKTQGRLALVAALRQVLRNALHMLGVQAPDRMDPVALSKEEAS